MSDTTTSAVDILQTAAMPTRDAQAFDHHFRMHRIHAAGEPIPAELAARIRGLAAGGARRIDDKVMAQCPKLEIIASFGVGTERVDLAAARRRGIIVTNTPDVLTEEVADLAMALLLSTIRRIPAADRFVRDGKWEKGRFALSPSLRGRKVGIVGLGNIGAAIARRLDGFGVEIAYCGRRRQQTVAYRYFATPEALAAAVDTLIVIVPGGRETANLIDARVLAALGPDGVLINVARGSVVDQSALISALQSGQILAAGLDVFADEPRVPAELIALDTVVLTPHIGSSSVTTWNDMSQLVCDNLVSWFRDGKALTPV